MLAQRTVLVVALGVAVAGCQKKTQEPAATEAATPATAPSEAPKQAEAPQAPAAPTGLPAPPDVAAPPKDAQKTASGLVTRVLTPGTGNKHPTDSDQVKVHYTGWTKDGKQFDSSVERGQPAVFGVSQVIPGWTEALKLMVAGEKRRIWIPVESAYGESPRMGAPAGALAFDVELIAILEPRKAPEDVKAPPAWAKRTPSGLAYRVLTPGTGKRHPKATDRVTVHYSGWTTD